MENKRLFIALAIDPAISRDITKKFNSLNLPWHKIRPVSADQLHLSLKFLGDFSIDKIPNLLASLEKVKLDVEDLEINIDKTEIFNPQQPKVLALAIEYNPQLQELYDQIEQILFDDGLAHKEVRRFSPHLTLARVKQASQLEEFQEFKNWPVTRSFVVSHFEIIESELTKNGPEYTSLQAFNL